MSKKRYAVDQSVIQNAAKTLLANIRFSSVDDPIKSIVVTSSVPNEGKSTVSTNLAEAMASSGKRTLIVECDMRKHSLYKHLGVHGQHGIYSVLTEQVTLAEAVVETHQPNLYFLDAEPSIPNPADIISSRRFAKLLKVLEETYDYVVVDTPPVGTFVDAAILSSLVDGAVFVVRENFTKRDEVKNAYEQLQKADANVIGAVLNYCEKEDKSSSYYYGYYGDNGAKKGAGSVSAPAAVPAASPYASHGSKGGKGGGRRFK